MLVKLLEEANDVVQIRWAQYLALIAYHRDCFAIVVQKLIR